MLERLVAEGSTDPFHHYALAMEYKRTKRQQDALDVFVKLREAAPDYLPMYMMAGLLLVELDRSEQAGPWFEQGIALARRSGDQKTEGELQDAWNRVATPDQAG